MNAWKNCFPLYTILCILRSATTSFLHLEKQHLKRQHPSIVHLIEKLVYILIKAYVNEHTLLRARTIAYKRKRVWWTRANNQLFSNWHPFIFILKKSIYMWVMAFGS